MENNEKYEIESAARRLLYKKLIDVLMADPVGWEEMCKVTRTDSIDYSLPTTPPAPTR